MNHFSGMSDETYYYFILAFLAKERNIKQIVCYMYMMRGVHHGHGRGGGHSHERAVHHTPSCRLLPFRMMQHYVKVNTLQNITQLLQV